jgi:tetratricopeptide (TPR) repeat protein
MNLEDFQSGLTELVSSGWLKMHEETKGLLFSKGADRDYILNGIDRGRLTELRQHATQLLENVVDRSQDRKLIEELLYQAQSIGNSGQMFKYAMSLSDYAHSNNQRSEALRYSLMALKHPNINQNDKAKLLLRVGDLYSQKGQPKEALDFYSDHLSSTVDGSEIAIVERKLGWCYAVLSDFVRANRHLNSSKQALKNSSDKTAYLQCLLDLAATKHLERNYHECQTTLHECESLLSDSRMSKEEAKFYNIKGILNWSLGHYDDSLKAYKESLEIYEILGDWKEAGRVANNIALLLRDKGMSCESREYMEKALRVAQHLNDQSVMCHLFNNLAITYRNLKLNNEAIKASYEALRLAKATSYNQGVALAYSNLGFMHISSGSLDPALHNLRQALTIFKKINDTAGEALAYYNIGEIYRISCLPRLAAEAYNLSLDIRRTLGEKLGIADNLAGLSRLYLEELNFDECNRNLPEAVKLYCELGKIDEATLLMLCKVEAFANAGKITEANEELYQLSRGQLATAGDPVRHYRLLAEGLLEAKSGNYGTAELKISKALRGFLDNGDQLVRANATMYLGDLYRQTGRVMHATRFWRESLGLYRELKNFPKIESLEALMSELIQ